MLTADVARYIALKRAVGFQFHKQEKALQCFADYAEARGENYVKRTTALDWIRRTKSPVMRRQRLSHLRGFALAMQAEDSRHEVPPTGVFGPPISRPPLQIFSRNDIVRLLDAAATAEIRGFQGIVWETLFGLLAAAGLRVSEVLALKLQDITEDGLIIHNTKFRKSRLVPLHESTRRALHGYLVHRMKQRSQCSNLFVNISGRPFTPGAARKTFLKLARQAGLRGPPGTRGLHIHSLRHAFAVRSLESCYGADMATVQNHMAALSTYLGHTKFANTQWYLHATPILMKQIAEAGEAFFLDGQK